MIGYDARYENALASEKMRRSMLDLSLNDWTELSALAGASVAFATLVLAYFTFRMSKESKRATEAAKLAVVAAQNEASATLELAKGATKDREMQWRPHVEVTAIASYSSHPRSIKYTVSNLGSGPGYRCRLFVKVLVAGGFELLSGTTFTASPDNPLNVNVSVAHPSAADGRLTTAVFDGNEGTRDRYSVQKNTWVVICEDSIGRIWRFSDKFEPQLWTPGSRDCPDWIGNFF